MATPQNRTLTAGGGSDLFTVTEAARYLRVGRTKAYLMTQEWRATGGRSGLPVVDLGNVLRVPRRALEEMIGAELTDSAPAIERDAVADGVGRESGPPAPKVSRSRPTRRAPTTTTRSRKNATPNQLDLFDSTD
ncbi:MAG: helix-turn-helix domain-containing protein [Acidimicrobiia bacterium]